MPDNNYFSHYNDSKAKKRQSKISALESEMIDINSKIEQRTTELEEQDLLFVVSSTTEHEQFAVEFYETENNLKNLRDDEQDLKKDVINVAYTLYIEVAIAFMITLLTGRLATTHQELIEDVTFPILDTFFQGSWVLIANMVLLEFLAIMFFSSILYILFHRTDILGKFTGKVFLGIGFLVCFFILALISFV
jgi:hypothetical protein